MLQEMDKCIVLYFNYYVINLLILESIEQKILIGRYKNFIPQNLA